MSTNNTSAQPYPAAIDNPYWVLGISQGSSRAEIIKAQMQAMKKKQYPVKVIAEAQKALMSPEKRILADFLLPCLPPIMRYRREDLSLLNQPVDKLKPLARYMNMDPSLQALVKDDSWDEQTFLSNHTDLKRLERLTYPNQNTAVIPDSQAQSQEDPNPTQTHRISDTLKKAQVAFKQKDYASVIECLDPLQPLLSQMPEKSSTAWMMLAKSYVMLNQPAKALAICQSLVDNPSEEIRSWAQIVVERLQSKVKDPS